MPIYCGDMPMPAWQRYSESRGDAAAIAASIDYR